MVQRKEGAGRRTGCSEGGCWLGTGCWVGMEGAVLEGAGVGGGAGRLPCPCAECSPPSYLPPGIPRPLHPPELPPYYPLSPGAVGQIPHPLGWLVPQ